MLVRALATIVLMLSASVLAAGETPPLDVVIRGGQIVDGTGAPAYSADVGLREGKIVTIGRLADVPARRTIDAAGLMVAPGFVDMMGQTATPLMDHPESALNLLGQGITTILAGEGGSAAPLAPGAKGARWTTMAEYLALLEKTGIPLNVAQNVGHTQVRSIVLGGTDRQPSPRAGRAQLRLPEHRLRRARGVCVCRVLGHARRYANMINDVTGLGMKASDLETVSRRVLTLERLFNLLSGFTSRGRLAARALLPRSHRCRGGDGRLPEDEFRAMRAEYYESFGWDARACRARRRIRELGLDAVLGRGERAPPLEIAS